MAWIAVGLTGAGLVNGYMANQTANANAAGARAAGAIARSDLAPWRQTGEQANNILWDIMNGKGTLTQYLQNDPAYQARLAEGENGIMDYGKMTGMRLSGRTMKAMERFRQGLASQEGNNYLNRLQSISASGQNAAAGQGGITMGTSDKVNAARTMGAEGINNSIQGGMNNYAAYLQQKQLLDAIQPSTPALLGPPNV